ncbi:MAG: folylpolyglutamate synthase/dihydrofolate synthase family protein [Mucinivorans sp.]
MTYEQTLNYLYESLPLFSRVGASAYKPGLDTSIALDEFCESPHRAFRSIHVAGTNGKGSTSQMIYEALRAAGYSVGLYTSPHLVDFRERIVVDGQMITRQAVVDFVERITPFLVNNPNLKPSFFELTSTLAFDYFRACGVEYAVIEVGMGGRLDSTNIITPILSVITNISMDHTQFLGTTLSAIAAEKAGIIKPSIPVVIGESNKVTAPVFINKAQDGASKIIFADAVHRQREYPAGMKGDYQAINAHTAAVALAELGIDEQFIERGIAQASVRGRWETLCNDPLTICDTGHNVGGIEFVVRQLARQKYETLYFVIGVVADKDLTAILSLLPRKAHYIFTAASIPRALAAVDLADKARAAGLQGEIAPTIAQAIKRARSMATPHDLIFIGGSTFTVAEAIPEGDF